MTVEPTAIERYGHSPRLAASLARLWATMADDYGLVSELPFDAVMARLRATQVPGTSDTEMPRCLPRLINLMVDFELSIPESIEVVDVLVASPWTDAQRHLLVETLDAWWYEVLIRDPGEHHSDYPPHVVLGLLARTQARMVRWLLVWLEEIDGPPAPHLAAALLDGLHGPVWDGQQDARQQVLAWARSETVVNGLALIGTTHIEPDVLGRVLDLLFDR